MTRKRIGWVTVVAMFVCMGIVGDRVITRLAPPASALSDVSMAGQTLAHGYLQPVNPKWWAKVRELNVMNAQGQTVLLPENRPLLFFAWWCPHCHAALRELARTGELSKLTLISTYVNAGSIDGKPVVIGNFPEARLITNKSLATMHLHVQRDHLFYLMPGPAQNALAIGVPDFVEDTHVGLYAMNGAPSDGEIWPLLLADAVNRHGGLTHG